MDSKKKAKTLFVKGRMTMLAQNAIADHLLKALAGP